MQSSHISLLERFGTSSTIMTYFGATHKSFLILTQLSRNTREMLDYNYEAFLNWMIWNNSTLNLKNDNKNILDLPWDLYKYWIYFDSESKVISFIELLQNINDKNGYYFNEHYMSNRLLTKKLIVRGRFLKLLHPHLELLKKTEVLIATENKYWNILNKNKIDFK